MFQNMFDRLLALFTAVILLMALLSGFVSVYSAYRVMSASRQEELLTQAKEIAFLASKLDWSSTSTAENKVTLSYLAYKSSVLQESNGAFMLIVDKNGMMLDNSEMLGSDTDALDSLTADEVSSVLSKVLMGEEVSQHIQHSSGPIFTVAVPWMKDDSVQGAVFIHTKVQLIETEYRTLLIQISIGFALSAIVSMAGTALYTRGVTRPLAVITQAAEDMSRGNLKARAEITGVNEVRQLAGAFNVMAEKLEKNEESRKEFVANVSHELRSPVTSIHGFVDGMLDGTIPQEEYPRYLQIVFDETSRMKRLIADLLQLSRMDKGVDKLSWNDFDINELIRVVLIGRMNDIEALNAGLHVDFFQEPCIVHADRDRISQVVHNVVDNALKYIEKNGNLSISTSLIKDSVVEIRIENDGEPIDPKDRDHLFERFYKADKAHTSGKGTGLGLSICKQIMNLHGQEMSVLPLEKGAGFRFTLQLTRRQDLPKLESKPVKEE